MKRKYSNLLIIIICLFLLSACKTSNNDNDITEPTTTSDQGMVDVTEPITDEVKSEWPKIEMIKNIERVEVEDVVLSEDFEQGETDFLSRGSANISVTDSEAYEGTRSLLVSGRSETSDSAEVNMSGIMSDSRYFRISAWIKYIDGNDEEDINCVLDINSEIQMPLLTITAKKGEWTHLEGDVIIPSNTQTSKFYFETGENLTSFFVDSINITEVTIPPADIPSVYEAYKDYFDIGISIVRTDIMSSERVGVILKHFNTITTGNELKPDSVLDYETCISDEKYDTNPAVKFTASKLLMDFAKENGLKMRGHTLVWHSQTPRWFFTEGYSKDPNAPLASKEKMLLRMENYIKNVLDYIGENYPGMFYAWDVVNEAINNDGAGNGYRSKDSLWYQTVGEEFVEKAFEYARKYAEPNVKLFYNDYQEYDIARRTFMIALLKNLKEKDLVDGMGMQSHISMGNPNMLDFEETIVKYADLGLEVQLTELDMHLTVDSEEEIMKQGERYQRIFEMLRRLKDKGVNITNVTFWGMDDGNTWLDRHHGEKSYPLLFDSDLLPKPAYWGVMGALD